VPPTRSTSKPVSLCHLCRVPRWVGFSARAVVAFSVLALSACGRESPTTPDRQGSFDITESEVLLTALGETHDLGFTARDAQGNARLGVRPLWSTGSAGVVAVDDVGHLTATGNGTTWVSGILEALRDSALVRVAQVVTRIELSPSTLTFRAPRDTARVTANAFDWLSARVAAPELVWSTLDPAVASVDAGGLVTALAPGATRVRASSGSTSAEVSAVVKGTLQTLVLRADSVVFSALEDTVRLTVSGKDQAGQSVEVEDPGWTTSDSTVATVDTAGLVRAKHNGNTKVTVRASGISASATIRVHQVAVAMDVREALITFHALVSTRRLTFEAKDRNGFVVADAAVMWSSRHPAVADVDSAGTVMPNADGVAYVLGAIDSVADSVSVTVRAVGRRKAITGYLSHACGIKAGSREAFCWGSNVGGLLGNVTIFDQSHVPYQVTGGSGFDAIAVGERHACATKDDGVARCWGSNADGQLGNGNTQASTLPVVVTTGEVLHGIVAGASHSCAMASDGRAFCWGANSMGQLGNGSTSPSTTPRAATAAEPLVQLAAGSFHTCGLAQSGKVYCWGKNGAGQLGRSGMSSSPTPAQVPSDQVFSEITAGVDHTCGITTAGRAYCWGGNGWGQAGVAGPSQVEPTAVSGGHRFVSIAAGGSTTCAVSVGQTVFCWGLNDRGQFGSTTLHHSADPREVAADVLFSAVTVGLEHVCAWDDGGDAYCWGGNTFGQTGVSRFLEPTQAREGVHFKAVAVGEFHSCAVSTEGKTYCAGNTRFWPLSGTEGYYAAQRIPGVTSQAIEASQTHTCAVNTEADGYCWGPNFEGETGRGSLDYDLNPTLVIGGHKWIEIDPGMEFTCGIATTSEVRCWGQGPVGDSRLTGASIGPGMRFTDITTGKGHVCGISAGSVYCWGGNDFGRLGNPDWRGKPFVKAVSEAVFREVHGGEDHTCALDAGGAAWCWGRNQVGQLGVGDAVDRPIPVVVAGEHRFASMGSGPFHACGLMADGTAYCWGANSYGELGDGTMQTRSIPVMVRGTQRFKRLSLGRTATCGITFADDLYCWGTGQLGGLAITRVAKPSPIGTPTFDTRPPPHWILTPKPDGL
jgi:alpha-tubulin suppressor-like RCC1 family protein